MDGVSIRVYELSIHSNGVVRVIAVATVRYVVAMDGCIREVQRRKYLDGC